MLTQRFLWIRHRVITVSHKWFMGTTISMNMKRQHEERLSPIVMNVLLSTVCSGPLTGVEIYTVHTVCDIFPPGGKKWAHVAGCKNNQTCDSATICRTNSIWSTHQYPAVTRLLTTTLIKCMSVFLMESEPGDIKTRIF